MKATPVLFALALAAATGAAQNVTVTGADTAPNDAAPRAVRHAPSRLLGVLDANQDAKLEAGEIRNAPAALRTLDKNNDGQLTRDEFAGPGFGRTLPAEGAPDAAERRPPLCPVAAALDANHDGVISAEEIQNASAALLALDKNQDGELTIEELRPAPPIPPFFDALDANHDGIIDADELARAGSALQSLDANHDGKLTLDEVLPGPPFGPRHSRVPNGTRQPGAGFRHRGNR